MKDSGELMAKQIKIACAFEYSGTRRRCRRQVGNKSNIDDKQINQVIVVIADEMVRDAQRRGEVWDITGDCI